MKGSNGTMILKVSPCGRPDINNIRKEQTFGPQDKRTSLD